MSHHIYQTEAFVIDSRNVGEANKIIYLYTKDLGLVAGNAQGVRLLKSKLRYSLQDFSYSKVSLVRGKEVWRITSAGLIDSIVSKVSPDSFVLARGLSLVKRLVHGEEKSDELWQVLESAFKFWQSRAVDSIEPEYFEYLLVLRILNSLGYVAPEAGLVPFLQDMSWGESLFAEVALAKNDLIQHINRALKESHL